MPVTKRVSQSICSPDPHAARRVDCIAIRFCAAHTYPDLGEICAVFFQLDAGAWFGDHGRESQPIIFTKMPCGVVEDSGSRRKQVSG